MDQPPDGRSDELQRLLELYAAVEMRSQDAFLMDIVRAYNLYCKENGGWVEPLQHSRPARHRVTIVGSTRSVQAKLKILLSAPDAGRHISYALVRRARGPTPPRE
jgi:hypothetical protein